MAQIKIFGLAQELNSYKDKLSIIIHSCIVDVLKFPKDKRFHRFFPLSEEDFYFPSGRSENYTIIEISLFEGRSEETKKEFIKLLFLRIKDQIKIAPNDIEITIFETPKVNWGIRGLPGDELELNYKVDV